VLPAVGSHRAAPGATPPSTSSTSRLTRIAVAADCSKPRTWMHRGLVDEKVALCVLCCRLLGAIKLHLLRSRSRPQTHNSPNRAWTEQRVAAIAPHLVQSLPRSPCRS
jgi:hypothetical protein